MPQNRIRQARLAAGMTLQEAAERLGRVGLRITRAALHKHESQQSRPSARALLHLAQIYDTSTNDLLSEPEVEILWLAFRRHTSLGKAASERVKAIATRRVERHLRLARLLGQAAPRFPSRQEVRTVNDAESLAEGVRRRWGLGEAPLESVTQTIEDHGGVVVEVSPPRAGFDGLSGVANKCHPVIVVNSESPADRRRYTLSHELGHIAMSCDHVTVRDQEPLAHRFAAAFIVPAAVALRELGARRRRLDLQELKALKARYGLSIQAWIRRALDLGIITESTYRSACRQVSAMGWRRSEPVVYDSERRPARLRQLVHRAEAEDVITHEEAAEMLADLTASEATSIRHPMSATSLLYATNEERDAALSRAAERAADDYASGGDLREFEANEERDLHDDTDP